MRMKSRERTISYWGCVPLAVFLVCVLLVFAAKGLAGSSLREAPRNILGGFGIVSIGGFLVWVNAWYKDYRRRHGYPVHRRMTALVKGVSIAVFVFVILTEIGAQGFGHRPEHVVEKHGMKMVAVVSSFLDETVNYYEYQNALFYGKQLGYEWYGSGGGDPLARDPVPEPIKWKFYDYAGALIDENPEE